MATTDPFCCCAIRKSLLRNGFRGTTGQRLGKLSRGYGSRPRAAFAATARSQEGSDYLLQWRTVRDPPWLIREARSPKCFAPPHGRLHWERAPGSDDDDDGGSGGEDSDPDLEVDGMDNLVDDGLDDEGDGDDPSEVFVAGLLDLLLC